MAKRPAAKEVLRRIVPYPAVFVPNHWGGWDVIFPNFPRSRAGGVNYKQALAAAKEELTLQIGRAFLDDHPLPRPSDPENLLPDEEEIPGTVLVMVEPDAKVLLRRLGLTSRLRRTSPDGQKYDP